MSEYQLEIKQIVDYPRCRIYRQFVQSLIADRNIRTNGGSGLFFYTVLSSYANFRTSYKRIGGINYTVYPGEWLCELKELTEWFHFRFGRQAISVLNDLQERKIWQISGETSQYSIENLFEKWLPNCSESSMIRGECFVS